MKKFDKRGKELQNNNYIIYAYLEGRSAGLKYGKVLEADHYPKNKDESAKSKIKVIGYDSSFKKCDKRCEYLEYADFLIIDENYIPKEIKENLDNYS